MTAAATSSLWAPAPMPTTSSTGGPVTAVRTYDPAQRLDQVVSSSGTTRFAYAGGAMIQEASTSGVILRRYVPGPGMDGPVM